MMEQSSGVSPGSSHLSPLESMSRMSDRDFERPEHMVISGPASSPSGLDNFSFRSATRPMDGVQQMPIPYNIIQFWQGDSPWNPLGKVGQPPIQPDGQRIRNRNATAIYRPAPQSSFSGWRSALPSECGAGPPGVSASDSGYVSHSRHNGEDLSVYGESTRDLDTQSLNGHFGEYHPFAPMQESLLPEPMFQRETWSNAPSSRTQGSPMDIGGNVKFLCLICKKEVKTKSELTKHDQRHRKPYTCDVPDCSRKGGFSTTNDRDRHKRSVHSDNLTPGDRFRCRLDNCATKDKIWPRADNFRSHLKRVHHREGSGDEDLVRFRVRETPQYGGDPLEGVGAAVGVSLLLNNTETVTEMPWPSVDQISPDLNDSQTGTPDLDCAADSPELQIDFPAQADPPFRGVLQSRQPLSPGVQGPSHPFSVPLLQQSIPSSCSEENGTAAVALEQKQGGLHHQYIRPGAVMKGGVEAAVSLPSQSATGKMLTGSQVKPRMGQSTDGPIKVQETAYTSTDASSTSDIPGSAPDPIHCDIGSPDLEGTKSSRSDITESWEADKLLHLAGAGEKQEQSEEVTDSGPPTPPNPQSQREEDILKYLDQLPKDVLEKYLKKYSGTQERKPLVAASGSSTDVHRCPNCPSSFARRCELKKHMKRHEKPYGCTFLPCAKKFGSKSDWKRHESTQHFRLEVWKCDELRVDAPNETCTKVCHRRETFKSHLQKEHKIEDPKAVEVKLEKCRAGRSCDAIFWCGFCQQVIEAERFDHIDDHFSGRNNAPKMVIAAWKSADSHPDLPDTDQKTSPLGTEGRTSQHDQGSTRLTPQEPDMAPDPSLAPSKRRRPEHEGGERTSKRSRELTST